MDKRDDGERYGDLSDDIRTMRTELREDFREVKDDIKSIRTDVSRISGQVEHNTKILDEHMRRTEASEKRIAIMEKAAVSWDTGLKVAMRLAGIAAGTALFFKELLPYLKAILK
jgi:methyl-accepting chemotaxis protein